MKIISKAWIEQNITLEDLIEPTKRAFVEASKGTVDSGILFMHPHPNRSEGDVVVKTACSTDAEIYVVKIAPWFAQNVRNGTQQGGLLAAFNSRTGIPIAIFDDGHLLSDLRTAAAGAIAAQYLAPEKVACVTVIGTGVQAFWQARALYGVRPFHTLQIVGRTKSKAEQLQAKLQAELPDVHVITGDIISDAIARSEVIITATGSRVGFLQSDMLRPGQHITAIGADDPSKCELLPNVFQRANTFVDSVSSASANGNLVTAKEQGLFPDLQEIGRLIDLNKSGRTHPSDLTISTFVGLGAQDLAVATHIINSEAFLTHPDVPNEDDILRRCDVPALDRVPGT